MQDYSNTIISSDFSSIGQVGGNTSGTISVPGGTSIGAGATYDTFVDIPIEGGGALRATIQSSIFSGEQVCLWFLSYRVWTGVSYAIPTYIVLSRQNATTIRASISIYNPDFVTITAPSTETFTIQIASMEVPY